MLMMKKILSLMLCLVCTVCATAQDILPSSGSGWTDQTGNYQAETVVYAVVKDNAGSDWWGELQDREGSQIAALVDGEVRALVGVESFNLSETPTATYRIYTFRVGGEDADLDKEISFQIYDASHGVTYPLTCTAQDGTAATPTWTGDATAVMPSNFYNLTYTSIYSVVMRPKSEEGDMLIQLRKGDIKNLLDYVDIELMGNADAEPTVPVSQGVWTLQQGDVEIASINGNTITALEAGYGYLMYTMGGLTAEPGVELVVEEAYVPMTTVAIEDITAYKGYMMPSVFTITYNGGESMPSYPYLDFTFDETKIELGEDENGNLGFIAGPDAKIGDVVTVTATAQGPFENGEDVASTTFTVTIGSVIDTYTSFKEEVTVWLDYGEMDLSNMVPSPSYSIVPALNNDSFYDYFDTENNDLYSYTVESDNPGVVDYNSDGILSAMKKGVANVTFTNSYDTSKKVTVTVYVNQLPVEIAITQVNGTEIPEASPTEPTVQIPVGQMVDAMSLLTPTDADYTNYTIRFVNANGEELEDMSWLSEESSVSPADDGLCIFNFMATQMPGDGVYLQAVVELYPDDTNGLMKEYILASQRVKVEFVNNVTSIEVPSEMTVWVDATGQNADPAIVIPAFAYPEDATNKELNIEFDESELVGPVPVDGNYAFTPLKKGTFNVTFTSVANPSVTASCKVTVKVRVSSIEYNDELVLCSDGMPVDINVTYLPENADYDPDYLSLSVNEGRTIPSLPDGWSPVEVINDNLYGRAICETFSMKATYDQGACEGLDAGSNTVNLTVEGSVKERLDVMNEWNWISLMSGYVILSEVEAFEDGAVLTEVRCQTQLTYNDPIFGFFGDLEEMVPGQAYKLDVAERGYVVVDNFSPDYSRLYGNEAFEQEITPRWNWLGYPYEYDYLLSEVYDPTLLADGDMVITKDGDMALVKDGNWYGDFYMERNTGFMLYHNGDGVVLPMSARGDFEQGYWSYSYAETKSKKASVWQYNGSRFANMMAIIGQLNIDSASDYTIGAYVGDECRGEGKVVNGLALISLAGAAGEEVTFRIHNEWTGEFYDVTTQIGFSDKAGTINNPVMLNVPEEVTAIGNVSTEGINISGNVLNLGDYTGVATITTVDGKVVAKTTEASISVDNLPSGVYVVAINGGSKPIVKKIVKE